MGKKNLQKLIFFTVEFTSFICCKGKEGFGVSVCRRFNASNISSTKHFTCLQNICKSLIRP